jgi:tripartite-type tricarboxylate transporter receptor subunit TctC
MEKSHSSIGSRPAVFLSVLVALFLAIPAVGADYPNGPVTMVVPFTPGGATDITGRAIAGALEPFLKQPVVCDNKAGGGGTVGWMWLSRQKPDGYTIGIATVSVLLQQHSGGSGLKISDFEPISMIAYGDNAIAVPVDSPYKTLNDLVEYARKNPGKIRIANSGTGNIWHICAVALEEKAGVKFSHVPFKGSKDAVTAMLGGHVEATTSTVGEVIEFVKAGKVKILGMPRKDRFALLPDVPTFRELGYDLQMGCLFGLLAPKGTPKEIVKALDEATKKAVSSEKYIQIQNDLGQEVRYLNSEDFAKVIKVEDAFYLDIIQKLGLDKK